MVETMFFQGFHHLTAMHPFLAPDFHIRWSTLVPEAVEPDIRHALEQAARAIEEICTQDPAAATYQSTFLALESATPNHGGFKHATPLTAGA